MIVDSHEHVMLPTALQLQKMKAANIDKTILFSTTPHPEQATTFTQFKQEMNILYKKLSGGFTKAENLKHMHHTIHELTTVLTNYPNDFYGFGPVPFALSTAETAQWIKTNILANQLKGIGEFTPGSDEQVQQLEPIFQALEQFPHLPIWVHTFQPVTQNGLHILMKLTKRYPTVPVIFGHMGGYHWMELIDFAKKCPNAFIDLSAAFSPLAARMAVTELPNRCLFSSDAPYGEPLLSKQLVESVSPTPAIAKKVLGENVLHLIGEPTN